MLTRPSVSLAALGLALTLSAPSAFVSSACAQEAKGETESVKAGDLTLTVPKDWDKAEVSNRLRLAQFTVPAAEGVTDETEYVVFYFGGGAGGTVDDNLARWTGQFAEEGRGAETVTGKSREGTYTLLDARGTYQMPVGPPIMRKTKDLPDARMLAAVIEVPGKGNYFLRLAGPAKTVDKHAEAFRTSFGAEVKSERPYTAK